MPAPSPPSPEGQKDRKEGIMNIDLKKMSVADKDKLLQRLVDVLNMSDADVLKKYTGSAGHIYVYRYGMVEGCFDGYVTEDF